MQKVIEELEAVYGEHIKRVDLLTTTIKVATEEKVRHEMIAEGIKISIDKIKFIDVLKNQPVYRIVEDNI